MPGRSNWLPARSRPGLVLDCGRPGGGFDGRMWQMPISENARSAAAIHRKLRGLAAVFLDPAATEHEKANGIIIKVRVEGQLGQGGIAEGTQIRDKLPVAQGHKVVTSQPCPKTH